LDLTLLINNFYLSSNRAQMLREMARITRPGGRIIVVEWKPIASPIGPVADRRMDQEQVKQEMKSPLVSYFDAFEAGPYHYGLIFTRTTEPV
jgi:ubiquinone/menaquinone biosynthesis C-methylase UbiE